MPLLEQLQHLGIDDKQSKVYLAALELGRATVHELAEKSGVKRTSIYNFVDEMKQSGLMMEIEQEGRTLFIPEDPNVLLEKVRNQAVQVENILPELLGIYNLPGNKPKVKYYEGEKGVFQAYQDMLASKETIYGYSDYEKMFSVMPHDLLWQVPETRVKNKQKFFCLAKNGEQSRLLQTKDKEQLREIRLLSDINLDTEINIYGNKVLMISFHKPYATVIIEDRAIAMSLKSIWQINWNMFGNTKNHTS